MPYETRKAATRTPAKSNNQTSDSPDRSFTTDSTLTPISESNTSGSASSVPPQPRTQELSSTTPPSSPEITVPGQTEGGQTTEPTPSRRRRRPSAAQLEAGGEGASPKPSSKRVRRASLKQSTAASRSAPSPTDVSPELPSPVEEDPYARRRPPRPAGLRWYSTPIPISLPRVHYTTVVYPPPSSSSLIRDAYEIARRPIKAPPSTRTNFGASNISNDLHFRSSNPNHNSNSTTGGTKESPLAQLRRTVNTPPARQSLLYPPSSSSLSYPISRERYRLVLLPDPKRERTISDDSSLAESSVATPRTDSELDREFATVVGNAKVAPPMALWEAGNSRSREGSATAIGDSLQVVGRD